MDVGLSGNLNVHIRRWQGSRSGKNAEDNLKKTNLIRTFAWFGLFLTYEDLHFGLDWVIWMTTVLKWLSSPFIHQSNSCRATIRKVSQRPEVLARNRYVLSLSKEQGPFSIYSQYWRTIGTVIEAEHSIWCHVWHVTIRCYIEIAAFILLWIS